MDEDFLRNELRVEDEEKRVRMGLVERLEETGPFERHMLFHLFFLTHFLFFEITDIALSFQICVLSLIPPSLPPSLPHFLPSSLPPFLNSLLPHSNLFRMTTFASYSCTIQAAFMLIMFAIRSGLNSNTR